MEFDLNDDTMVYASYTRGFKPGGSNLTYGREDVIAPIVVLPTFKDETVDAWELGIKTDFANNRVRLNAAAFYYEYKNLQYQATDPEVFEGGVGNCRNPRFTARNWNCWLSSPTGSPWTPACPGWRRRSPSRT